MGAMGASCHVHLSSVLKFTRVLFLSGIETYQGLDYPTY